MDRGPSCAWSALIPLERELRERVDWFIRLRWLAVLGILGGAWGATTLVAIDLPPLPLYAIGVLVAAYNGVFVLVSRRYAMLDPGEHSCRKLVYAQIGLDWGALVCLIHYAGGVQGPMPLVFVFHLIIGSFLLSRRACYGQAGVVALLLGMLILLEQGGYWPAGGSACLAGGLTCQDGACLVRWVTLSLFMAVTVFLTTSITVPLRRKEEALFASEQALVQAHAEVQALSEERAWFARMTHHQLRAPLAVVKSMLEALRFAGELNDKQQEIIHRCRRRVDELLGMIRDLLDLAAAQRPRDGGNAGSVELASCLERAVETAGEHAARKQVRLETDLGAGVAVRADAEDMERIFANLLDNAVKYTPPGGVVHFTVARDAEWVVAVVTDTGIGIAERDQQRVFQGFYRTEAAKSSGETGSGMGLSIVARLVERWGGDVRLESEGGHGSRFTVRLPVAG